MNSIVQDLATNFMVMGRINKLIFIKIYKLKLRTVRNRII